MVGITIGTQRQLEFGRNDHDADESQPDENNEMLPDYTKYHYQKSQSEV
jgi:hypothetical protein